MRGVADLWAEGKILVVTVGHQRRKSRDGVSLIVTQWHLCQETIVYRVVTSRSYFHLCRQSTGGIPSEDEEDQVQRVITFVHGCLILSSREPPTNMIGLTLNPSFSSPLKEHPTGWLVQGSMGVIHWGGQEGQNSLLEVQSWEESEGMTCACTAVSDTKFIRGSKISACYSLYSSNLMRLDQGEGLCSDWSIPRLDCSPIPWKKSIPGALFLQSSQLSTIAIEVIKE